MLAKRLKPMTLQARRLYVELMFQVMGRAMQGVSEVDASAREEAKSLPGSNLIDERLGEGYLKYLGTTAPRPIDLSIQFKHIAHAYMVVSFQEKTAIAFANDRMLVDGDVSYAIRMTRILNRLEAFILPKLVASRAVKEYPANLGLPEKVVSAARIYLKVANLFFDTARAS